MTSLGTLLATLHSDDPRARQQAALRLGTVDTSDVMGELVPLMASEPDDFVRETLVWAVVARPAAATPALVAALLRDDLPHEPVLHALSKVGDPATVAAVLPHAGSADPVVATKAWWALARMGDASAVPALLRHLGAPDADRRHGLTRALLQLGEPALQPLAAVLDDASPARRSHAAEVLVALADPTRYGTVERRTGRDLSVRAQGLLRAAKAPEVDGALVLATLDEDHPALADVAARLRAERSA